MYDLLYTEQSRQDLHKLETSTAKRIIKKLHFFSIQNNPIAFAKKLSNPALGQYRFRIGTYRALFDLDQNGHLTILKILRIKHRKDIYDLA